MEDIIRGNDTFYTPSKFNKKEIFIRLAEGEEPMIQGSKLQLFLEALEKKLDDTQSKLPFFVSEELYRHEIQERYELKRRFDTLISDVNYLREFVYFEGKDAILDKEKSTFILGEIENLKMLMKRIETQQYEGLDLFRRLKKAENHIVVLAKEIHERDHREKLLNSKFDELQSQFNEFKENTIMSQQANEKNFLNHHDRILEIEQVLEEEEEENKHSLLETRNLMRSMSSINEEEEDELTYQAFHDAAEEMQDTALFREVSQGNGVVRATMVAKQLDGLSRKSSIVTFRKDPVPENQHPPPEIIPTESGHVIISKDKQRPTSASSAETNRTEEKPVEVEAHPPHDEKLLRPLWRGNTVAPSSKENFEQAASSSAPPKVIAARHTTIGTAGDYSNLRKPIRHTVVATPNTTPATNNNLPAAPVVAAESSDDGNDSVASSTRSTMISSGRPSVFFGKQKSMVSLNGKNGAKRRRRSSSTMNSQIMEFLKTQFIEKINKLEEENNQFQGKIKEFHEKLHHANNLQLKRISIMFATFYIRSLQRKAFEKLKYHTQNFHKRLLEKKKGIAKRFYNKILLVYLSTSTSHAFMRWKTNYIRLKQGEKLKNYILPRVEHWYRKIKPDLKDYLMRWKVFTIGSYRSSLYNGDDEDADAIRNANNQYFMNLRQIMLNNKGEFNLEELKQTALNDLKQRWSADDRKAREEARYKVFQDRMILFFNNYYEQKFREEKLKMNEVIERLLQHGQDIHYCKTNVQKMVITFDNLDSILNEKMEIFGNKFNQLFNNFKSQMFIQLTQLKDSIEEKLALINKKLFEIDEKNLIYDQLKISYDKTKELVAQISTQISVVIGSRFDDINREISNIYKKDEEKNQLIHVINENIFNQQKNIEKTNKIYDFRYDEMNNFFSEEITWLKNVTKNFHLSFNDYKLTNDNTLVKLNKTLELILSGETSYETYLTLLRNVVHYYKQYEFYKLIGIQQNLLFINNNGKGKNKNRSASNSRAGSPTKGGGGGGNSNEQQPENTTNTTNENSASSSSAAIDESKLAKLLKELKDSFSEKFLKEQRIKIAHELSECARRIAFYIVVKSDNYVTSYYVLNNLLKLNYQFDHMVPEQNHASSSSQRPSSANPTNHNKSTKSSTKQQPPAAASLPNPTDDNEFLNKRFFDNYQPQGPMAATTSADPKGNHHHHQNSNISIDSVREEYLNKVKTEINEMIYAKDNLQSNNSKTLAQTLATGTNENVKNMITHENIMDYLTITNANLPMVRELREKFLLQFLKVIQLTLLSFPKIPFFHGVHSFLKATSIFPSSSSNGVNQMNLLDELCMACNRPMAMTAATTMQPFAGGTSNPSHHHQARPRSASHVSSTYHHRDPFANLQYQENYHHHNNQTMTRAMSPTTSNGNNMFIPINLLPNQQFAASIPLVLSPTMSHDDQVLEDLPPPTHSYDSADQPRQQQQQQRQDQLLQASFSAPSFEESPGGHSAHKVLRMKSSNLTNNNNNNVASSAPPPAAVTDSRKINDIFAIKTTLGNPVPRKKTNSLSATATSTSSNNNNNANTNNKTHTTLVTSISLPMINTMNHEEDEDIHGNQEEFDRFPPQTIRPQSDPPPMLMATLPVMTTELLVDSLAHQFPKDVSIHSKHVESEKITNLIENEMNMIHARKLIGKEEN